MMITPYGFTCDQKVAKDFNRLLNLYVLSFCAPESSTDNATGITVEVLYTSLLGQM